MLHASTEQADPSQPMREGETTLRGKSTSRSCLWALALVASNLLLVQVSRFVYRGETRRLTLCLCCESIPTERQVPVCQNVRLLTIYDDIMPKSKSKTVNANYSADFADF